MREKTRTFFRSGWFMTRIAVWWQRGELALLVMTQEAVRVRYRARLAVRLFGFMAAGAFHIAMLVMWERDVKL